MVEERVERPRGRLRRVVAVMAAGAVLVGLAGCTVSSGPQDQAPTKVTDVLDRGPARFDLTRPPSRDAAGLPAGRTAITYQREDHAPFPVQLVLPHGRELVLDVRLLSFDTLAEPDPLTAPPTTLDIQHYPANLAAGRDHLLEAAKEYGLEIEPILAWYEEASGPRPAAAPSTVRTPWLSAAVGYLRLEVQGRYKPAIDGAGADQTVVHYLFTWDADRDP